MQDKVFSFPGPSILSKTSMISSFLLIGTVVSFMFFDEDVELDGLDGGLPSVGFDGLDEGVGLDAGPPSATATI